MCLAGLALALLCGTCAVYAEIGLGTSPPAPSSPTVSGRCSKLTLDRGQSVNDRVAGGPSTLVFGCGRNGDLPAFSTAHGPGGKALLLTPSFSLPIGWALSISKSRSIRECSFVYGMTSLRSGQGVILQPDTSYVYCLSTASASSFASFSVTWSR